MPGFKSLGHFLTFELSITKKRIQPSWKKSVKNLSFKSTAKEKNENTWKHTHIKPTKKKLVYIWKGYLLQDSNAFEDI